MAQDSIFEQVTDCILGSLRLILFLVILLLTTITISATVYLNISIGLEDGKTIDYVLLNIVLIVPLLTLILGAHGFFYKNITSLNLFSIILFVSAGISLVTCVILVVMSGTITKGKFENYLNSSLDNYVWAGKPKDIQAAGYAETTFWDGIQTVFSCCGIEGPSDWDSHKAKASIAASSYPRSCCLRTPSVLSIPSPELAGNQTSVSTGTVKQQALCDVRDIYQTGCRSSIKLFWETLGYFLAVISILYIITGCIARLIISEVIEEAEEARQDAINSADIIVTEEVIQLSDY